MRKSIRKQSMNFREERFVSSETVLRPFWEEDELSPEEEYALLFEGWKSDYTYGVVSCGWKDATPPPTFKEWLASR